MIIYNLYNSWIL